MSVSLRGELTNHAQTVFRHPNGTLSERATTLTALGYAIAEGNLEKVKGLLKGHNSWLLNDADYSGNTPVVSFLRLGYYYFVSYYAQPLNNMVQHIAAHSPNVEILRYFLLQGASVHIRNRAGRTPLFLAANAGLPDHVILLRQSGAHLHADERPVAEMQARRRPGVWALAGIGPKTMSERDLADRAMETSEGQQQLSMTAGSAPS